MRSFIIGKIGGEWRNFVPPIQGGEFRMYNGVEGDEKPTPTIEVLELCEPQSSSESSSLIPSGDEHIVLDPSLRRRRATSLSSSVTSISETAGPTGGPAAFDADYLTRKAIEEDIAKYPSLDYNTQKEIAIKYRALEAQIRAEGLFNCNYLAYAREVSRYTALFIGAMICLKYGWYKTSAFLLGCFWHQLVFAAHDAGHMGITHNFQFDTCMGIVIADFLGGLSMGWWKRSHNVRPRFPRLPPVTPG